LIERMVVLFRKCGGRGDRSLQPARVVPLLPPGGAGGSEGLSKSSRRKLAAVLRQRLGRGEQRSGGGGESVRTFRPGNTVTRLKMLRHIEEMVKLKKRKMINAFEPDARSIRDKYKCESILIYRYGYAREATMRR
jgi:hypothetical protein